MDWAGMAFPLAAPALCGRGADASRCGAPCIGAASLAASMRASGAWDGTSALPFAACTALPASAGCFCPMPMAAPAGEPFAASFMRMMACVMRTGSFSKSPL